MAKTIGATFQGRDNNFTAVRLLAATAVLLSHAFQITTGRSDMEPMVASTGYSLGEQAVHVFFGLSGFLVAASIEQRRDAIDFAVARALRIFPGLIVCVLVSALLIGPIVTTLPLIDYFTDPATAGYVLRTTALTSGAVHLPGVFDHLPVAGVISATTWTLKYEALSYALLVLATLIGLTATRARVGVLTYSLLALTVYFSATTEPFAHATVFQNVVRFLTCFSIGVSFYKFRDHVVLDWRILLVLTVLAIAGLGTALHNALMFLAQIYAVMFFGLGIDSPAARSLEGHDISYGIYLYGWPIEQLVRHFSGSSDPWVIIALALPLTLIVAMASWHWIEQPALTRRRMMTARLRALYTPEPQIQPPAA